MGEATKIQWTDHTFNPWMGCAKVHTGCTNCYAEKALPVSMRPGGKLQWGEVWQGGQRAMKADSGWREPMKWAREAASAGERRRVFCASLADVLEVPAEPPRSLPAQQYAEALDRVREARRALDNARAQLWNFIRLTSRFCACGQSMLGESDHSDHRPAQPHGGLDWLLLTKRPENWHLVPEDVRPLVWLGTSVSDQKTADEWVPRLLKAEGFRYRFLSLEPMVGPVDLTNIRLPSEYDLSRSCPAHINSLVTHDDEHFHNDHPRIDWVIVGGESGPKARPCHVEWVRDVVRQCRVAGVPVFVKQLGSAPSWTADNLPDHLFRAADASDGGFDRSFPAIIPCSDPKGGDMAEWPEDLRVREVPHGF